MKVSTVNFVDLVHKLHGRDVLVISCGPSMSKWREIYEQYPDDKKPFIICIKQSIYDVDIQCDLHVFNHCNLVHYKYTTPPHLRVFGVADRMKNRFWFVSRDYTYLVKDSDDFCNSLSHITDANSFYEKAMLSGHQIWGPGIMHEFIFPLLLTAKVSSITTVGWDIASDNGQNIHYFDVSDKIFLPEEKFQKRHFALFFDKATPNITSILRRIKSYLTNFCWFIDYYRNKKVNVVAMMPGEAELVSRSYCTLLKVCRNKGIQLNVISNSKWLS